MFANSPLSLDFYRDDIENAQIRDIPDLTQNVEVSILEEELKMSCTNVLLQCLDSESRCILFWEQCLNWTAVSQVISWE